MRGRTFVRMKSASRDRRTHTAHDTQHTNTRHNGTRQHPCTCCTQLEYFFYCFLSFLQVYFRGITYGTGGVLWDLFVGFSFCSFFFWSLCLDRVNTSKNVAMLVNAIMLSLLSCCHAAMLSLHFAFLFLSLLVFVVGCSAFFCSVFHASFPSQPPLLKRRNRTRRDVFFNLSLFLGSWTCDGVIRGYEYGVHEGNV